ncbi:hypothetical protein ACVWW3_002750 [Bradyrhizobium sp. LM2.9]
MLERFTAAADHGLDQRALAGRSACRLRDLSPVAEHGHRVGHAQDVLDEMRDEDDCRAFRAQAPQRCEQPFDLGRGKSGGRLVQDDDARAGEQHARDLDQLLKPDREVAEPAHRIDVDAEAGELFAGLARHAPPLYQAEPVGRLVAQKHVLGDREVGGDR